MPCTVSGAVELVTSPASVILKVVKTSPGNSGVSLHGTTNRRFVISGGNGGGG